MISHAADSNCTKILVCRIVSKGCSGILPELWGMNALTYEIQMQKSIGYQEIINKSKNEKAIFRIERRELGIFGLVGTPVEKGSA